MRTRTIIFCLVAIPVLVIIAVIFARPSGSSYDSADSTHPARLSYAALPHVAQVFMTHPPKADYTRKIVDVATIDAVEKRIDKCDGPVAVPVFAGSTMLIAEHDYCGGAAWIGKINVGQAVALSGPGIQTGTYVADELSYQLRGKAIVNDLPRNDVVLQTCVSKTELVLVSMRRVA